MTQEEDSGLRITVVGPAVVDDIQRADGSRIRSPGGTGVIIATCIHRALLSEQTAVHVDLSAAVGTDKSGDYLVDFLVRATGSSLGLAQCSGRSTKVNSIIVDDTGSWQFTSSQPAVTPYLRRHNVKPTADIVVIGALNSLLVSDPAATMELLENTSAQRRFITLSRGGTGVPPQLWDLVSQSDWVLCNLNELSGAFGRDATPDVMAAVTALGWTNAVVTNGGMPAWMIAAGARERLHPRPVQSPSTVGAGDVFAATFIVECAMQRSVKVAAQAAVEAGTAVAEAGSWLAAL